MTGMVYKDPDIRKFSFILYLFLQYFVPIQIKAWMLFKAETNKAQILSKNGANVRPREGTLKVAGILASFSTVDCNQIIFAKQGRNIFPHKEQTKRFLQKTAKLSIFLL